VMSFEEMAESLYEQLDGELPERQRNKEAMTDGGTKRKRIPSVLVNCRDCGDEIEVDSRTFDLAIEVGPGWFLCNECRNDCSVEAGGEQ